MTDYWLNHVAVINFCAELVSNRFKAKSMSMQLQHSYPPLNLNAKFFMQKLVDNEEIRGSV
jgi:hypothetical protein